MKQETKKREKGVEFRTPVGTALWPSLATADTRYATSDKPFGHFGLKIILPLSDPRVAKMIDDLEALRQAALADAQSEMKPGKKPKEAQYSWQPELDEQGQETGNVIIGLKKVGAFKRDDGTVVHLSVDCFDTAGNRVPKELLAKMGSGSKVAAIFEAGGFATGLGAGVSLRLKAVQVHDLVEFGSRSASAYGFETTGDGFVAEEAAPETPFNDTEATPNTPAPADDDI